MNKEEIPMDEIAEEIAISFRFEIQAVNNAKVEQRRQLKSLKEHQEKINCRSLHEKSRKS